MLQDLPESQPIAPNVLHGTDERYHALPRQSATAALQAQLARNFSRWLRTQIRNLR